MATTYVPTGQVEAIISGELDKYAWTSNPDRQEIARRITFELELQCYLATVDEVPAVGRYVSIESDDDVELEFS